jgi:1-acyl-sn-glycerol-3-phosphate acyltransferase
MPAPPETTVESLAVTSAGRPSRVSRWLACWRLLRAVIHALHGGLICAVVFPFLDEEARRRRVGWWSRRMLTVMGIRLETVGALQPAPVLLLANHVSWLDILAIDAWRPVRFVSKADVRKWPLLGFMVACGGTLFIERERKRDAMRVVHEVAGALEAGDAVGVFPEGTTGPGDSVLPFHANLLQAAVSTGAPVQPVVLRYGEPGRAVSPAVQYLDDTTLLGSLLRVAGARGIVVHVSFLDPEPAAGRGRRELAQALHERVAVRLAAEVATGSSG